MASAAAGSPCGACKFLRRKCAPDCIFAPYFCPDQGPERFAAIHKVFGASNVSKLLLHVPVHDRGDAVLTVGYEAQARLRDPVYGCVAHIYALQKQVACLQAQLMQLRAQMTHNNMIQGNKPQNQQWTGTSNNTLSSSMVSRFLGDFETGYNINSSISPPSSIESTTSFDEDNRHNREAMLGMPEMWQRQECAKRQRTSAYCHDEWSELQELALKMMKD
uniref:LOB domain-containing protein n=1 Tax=Kalanchoe fedtschenkoi TaxID=63787 RepID=A0A7N0VH00_KALFE